VAPLTVHRALAEAVAGAQTVPAVAPQADAAMVLRPAAVAGQLRRLQAVHQYVVQTGDTVPTICARAGISVATLMQVNHLPGVDDLVVGDPLLIPPVDGRMVPVMPGDTLTGLAAREHADPAVVAAMNGLAPMDHLPKQLFVPALEVEQLLTREEPEPTAPFRQDFVRFVWPTRGVITQYFWQYHPGLDI
jgi:LysM repeat protein